jgi:Flp pilus assembly protein TadG
MRLMRLAYKRFISEEHRMFLAEDRGSASVEFVVLALPLFIPIFIFLGQFSSLSSHEMAMQTLARESLRAFVESKSDESGGVLINEVINVGGEKLGLSATEVKAINVDIECSKSPCHSPNGRVRITLTMDPSVNHGRQVIAAAQEYFSPWIN